MLQIKGTLGGGGGHVLRTALTLATIMRRSVEIVDFVSSDPAPGLRSRHLAQIQALATISGATVTGAALNSRRLTFAPGSVTSGEFRFEASRGGSEPGDATALMRTLLPALLLANGSSIVDVVGTTHRPGVLTATELQTVLAPTLRKFGFRGEIGIAEWGLPPSGGGVLRARIEPTSALRAVDLSERGPLLQIGGISVVAGDDPGAGERMKNRAVRRLAEVGRSAQITTQRIVGDSGSKMLFLLAVFERATAGFTGVGTAHRPAEEIGDVAIDALFAYLQSQTVVERGLGEDLLLYAALAEGTSTFSVQEISGRTLATIELVKRFVPVRVEISGRPGGPGELSITGIGLRR